MLTYENTESNNETAKCHVCFENSNFLANDFRECIILFLKSAWLGVRLKYLFWSLLIIMPFKILPPSIWCWIFSHLVAQ